MSGVSGNQFNNFNTKFGIFGVKGKKPEHAESSKSEEKRPEVSGEAPKRPQVSANDVLSFMANSSIMNTVAKTKQINPAKYVTAEQKADIAKSMQDFEKTFENHFNHVLREMPNLSEAAAMTLAAKMVEEEI